MKEKLENLLHRIRESIDVYLSLPEKKQHKKKYWEAFCDLVHLERTIEDTLLKEE